VEEGLGLARAIDGWDSSRACAGLRPEVDEGPDEWAPLLSEAKGWRRTPSGWSGVGPGPKAGLGRFGRRGLFTLFFVLSFFFFCFLVYFISFANLIQINSTHFLISSNNQHNVLS
jgi:hypothetical protein